MKLLFKYFQGDGLGKSYRRMLVFQPPPVLIIHIDRYQMVRLIPLYFNSIAMKRLYIMKIMS